MRFLSLAMIAACQSHNQVTERKYPDIFQGDLYAIN
jgi:hypothetical protein